jgi:hypothetical protein
MICRLRYYNIFSRLATDAGVRQVIAPSLRFLVPIAVLMELRRVTPRAAASIL